MNGDSRPGGSTGDEYELTTNLDVMAMMRRLEGSSSRVTVLMPVYNAVAAVTRSLDALRAHTSPDVDILVIDDASTDERIAPLLRQHADAGRVRVLTNDVNLGFTRTVNRGLGEVPSGDVVLLNSDADVGPLWLQRLRWVAYTADDVATVSAVSDFAGTMSLPVGHQRNAWHPRVDDPDFMSRLVGRGMYVWAQTVPAAHGFCMYIRRQALDAIGGLDEEAFPFGYGEEVDFSQRAIAAGLRNLVAPHVMVRHARAQSFGVERRRDLVAQSRTVLAERHPTLTDQVRRWETSVGDCLIRIVARRLAHTPPMICRLPMRMLVVERGADDLDGDASAHDIVVAVGEDGVQVSERCPWQPHANAVTDDLVHAAGGSAAQDVDLISALAQLVIMRGVEQIGSPGGQTEIASAVEAVASGLGIPLLAGLKV